MKKLKSLIHLIRNILLQTFTAVVLAIVPLLAMYVGTQVSSSRIKKYGDTSPEGFEAIKIEKWIDIICIVLLVLILLWLLWQIIRILRKKIDPITEYDNLPVSEGADDKDIKVEENIFGEKIYKKDGVVLAKVEKDVFGDEVVKDSSNRVIGKGTYNVFTGKTNYENKNYERIATKEEKVFGNSMIKTKNGETYEEKRNTLKKKK